MPLFQKPACDWMLVGLGNPGAQYARTRHNMGFLALDALENSLAPEKRKAVFRRCVQLRSPAGRSFCSSGRRRS